MSLPQWSCFLLSFPHIFLPPLIPFFHILNSLSSSPYFPFLLDLPSPFVSSTLSPILSFFPSLPPSPSFFRFFPPLSSQFSHSPALSLSFPLPCFLHCFPTISHSSTLFLCFLSPSLSLHFPFPTSPFLPPFPGYSSSASVLLMLLSALLM